MDDPIIQSIHVVHPRPKPLKAWLTQSPAWLRPFIALEWFFNWIAYWLSSWGFVAVLQYVGTFSILIGLIFYFSEAPDRLKQKHYQAWQVINTAQGKGGAGGRIEALTELNNDGEPLVGVDISKAFLEKIQLPHATLRRAELSRADMMGANLAQADIPDADLEFTNLRGADLEGVNLQGSYLKNADLTGANLRHADLRNAVLTDADLRHADLQDIQWKGERLRLSGVTIYGVKNAPPGFIDAAMKMGASTQPDDDAGR
jgi:hypothetical protein